MDNPTHKSFDLEEQILRSVKDNLSQDGETTGLGKESVAAHYHYKLNQESFAEIEKQGGVKHGFVYGRLDSFGGKPPRGLGLH